MTFIPAQFASRVVRTIGVTSLALLSLQALAQEVYPNRPVVVISPWPAGGPAEAIIRPIAEKLTQRLGQQFVVDSKGGANGTIGAALVARAKSDGYTLLFSHVGPIAISPSMPNKPPYDPIKDFAPITQIASGPTVLVVRSDFPARNLMELVDFAKNNPGKVSYGSVGIGSTTHLAGETLARMTGTQMIHVPYRGSALINTDILGGQITGGFVNVAGVMALINDGKLRPIAVSTIKRSSVLPNVPTVAEMLPGFEVNSWYGLMAPANTPPAIIQKLNEQVLEILKMPDIVARMKVNGLDPEGTTPEVSAAGIKADIVRWAAAIKAADIKE